MSEFKLKNVASRVPCPRVHGECWGARVKLLRGARACSALEACISDTLSSCGVHGCRGKASDTQEEGPKSEQEHCGASRGVSRTQPWGKEECKDPCQE